MREPEHPDPLELDELTAERILRGASPDDVPPEYRGVPRV
jgi:hypothetical protein